MAGGTCTSVPTGASNVSSPSVNRAVPRSDDVQLLGAVGLPVRLDHVVAFVLADPDVEAEGLEAEPAAQRAQDLGPGRGRQTLQVVDREDLVAGVVAHRARNSRSTTGSI